MGTITITLNDVEVYLDGRTDLLAEFAGAAPGDDVVYDTTTNELEVATATTINLQTAYDDFAALYDEWKTLNGKQPPTLAEYKTSAKNAIDAHAGEVRTKFITSAPGQELTYAEKSDEATDYVAAGYPADLSSYPFIAAEVAATSKSNAQAADDILAQKSAWIAVGAQIEQQRLGGKVQIDAAADESAVDTIVTNTKAALDAIS